MFNEQSVGERVISKTYGIGKVTKLYLDTDSKHLRVDFNSGQYWYFDFLGRFDEKPDSKIDIMPYQEKQGSPDARRIVAMLASTYKVSKKINKQCPMSSHAQNEGLTLTLYTLAKQLLGDNNERI